MLVRQLPDLSVFIYTVDPVVRFVKSTKRLRTIGTRLGESKMQRIVLVGLMGIMFPLLSGCETTAGSETSRTICRELERDLPTYSVKDTPETLDSGARFMDVFHAVCGGEFR